MIHPGKEKPSQKRWKATKKTELSVQKFGKTMNFAG